LRWCPFNSPNFNSPNAGVLPIRRISIRRIPIIGLGLGRVRVRDRVRVGVSVRVRVRRIEIRRIEIRRIEKEPLRWHYCCHVDKPPLREAFPLNKELVVENHQEQSLVARRVIKDHILHVL